ncbi:MAG: lipoprotein insertase outer membrane protein LolB [Steroidobacteraceae bacterium]
MNPRLSAACAISLLAAGCATLPVAGVESDWPARRSELQALDHWMLNGRIAVAAGSEGFSGGVNWRQDADRAVIELRGPMGGTAMSIRVDGQAVAITDDHGRVIDGEAAQDRIAEDIGTTLPVAEMRYWLVGVPAPGAAHRETLGADHRLAALEQGGWQVRYLRYETIGSQVLPARMEITTESLRLRVAVADWRLPP